MLTQKYLDIMAGDLEPLNGYQTFAATTAATTIITIPVNSFWDGSISLSCSASEVAAGTVAAQALGVISLSGAGTIPAAGNYMACQAIVGANVVAGLTGDDATNSVTLPFTIVTTTAACLVQVTTTIAGTASRVDAMCSGLAF